MIVLASKRLTHPTVSYTASKLGARRETKSELKIYIPVRTAVLGIYSIHRYSYISVKCKILVEYNICIVHLSFIGKFLEQANWLEFIASLQAL